MALMEKGPAAVSSLGRSEPAREAEIRALRGALRVETRLAEALACRTRGLISTFELLTQRALDGSRDLEEARARLDALGDRIRAALEAGEAAWRRERDLEHIAERTLAPFETGEGPRISWSGPAVALGAEAARLAALTFFELASRSLRHGALALAEGRASVEWRRTAEGGLRIVWREYGAPPDSEGLRGGAGGSLLPLLVDRFGAPLRVHVTPFGLEAALLVPERDLDAPQAAETAQITILPSRA